MVEAGRFVWRTRRARRCGPGEWSGCFVFIADRDHVIFRATRRHTQGGRRDVEGFEGCGRRVLDTLMRHGCESAVGFIWRFWRCRDPSRPSRWRLWDDRECSRWSARPKTVRSARPSELGRPSRCWSSSSDGSASARRWMLGPPRRRSPITTTSVRDFAASHRRSTGLDNNISEGALRNLVLGRRNWGSSRTPTGCAGTRSSIAIASCALHGLDATRYLDEVLRLAPHWSTTRMLECRRALGRDA